MTKTTFKLGSSNPLSTATISWIFKLLLMFLFKAPEDFLFTIEDDSKADVCAQRLSEAWSRQEKRPQPSMLRALFEAFGARYMLLGLWKLAWAVATWGSAWYILKKLMAVTTRTMDWALILFAASLLAAVSIQALYSGAFKISLKVRSAMTMLVYNKSLTLPPQHVGIGEIVNMVSIDIDAVAAAALHFHFLWSGSLEIVYIVVLLILEAGMSSLYPIIVVVVALPIQLFLGKKVSDFSATWIETSGERLHIMTEILTAVKLLKFYTWEQYFTDRVGEVRRREAQAAGSQILARAANFAMVFAVPVLGALACLISLQLKDGKIDPVLAFIIVSLLNTLRYPLLMMPMAVKACSSAANALETLNRFMKRPQLVDYRQSLPMKSDPVGKKGVVEIVNADLAWGDNTNPTLSNVSMHCYPGEVIAVVGTVGSGKSTLIGAILGQTNIPSGSVRVVGKTSYCPQEAWLINASIQDNILFGSPMDRARYTKVIEVCCLARDLSLFAEGDQTMIAERGANLSGGQKQRVSMARAVYNQSDIVLLDDPLSALDQKVGRTIFEKCIKGFLKDRAVIMVTHGLQYLYQVDRVMLMGDGNVIEYGKYTELMAKPGGKLRTLMESHSDIVGERLDQESDDAIQRFNTIQIPTEDDGNDLVSVQVNQARRNEDQDTDERVLNRISQYNHGMEVDDNTLKQKAEYDHLTTNGPYHPAQQLSNVPSFARSVARNELSILTYRSESVEHERSISQRPTPNRKKVVVGPVRYMRSGAGGLPASIAICIGFFAVHSIRMTLDVWVKIWTANSSGLSMSWNAIIFCIFCVSFSLGVALRGYILAKMAASKSRHLHDRMLDSLMHAPMSFYDHTPLGRILQVSSEHQGDADDRLPDALLQFLQYAPLAIGSLIIACLQSSWWLTPTCIVLVLLAVLVFIFPHRVGALKFFRSKSRVAKPKLYSHVATSLEGLFSIRAFNAQARFRQLTITHLDDTNTWEIGSQNIRYFVALYVDVVCSLAIFATAYFFAIETGNRAAPAKVGLAIANILQLLVFVQWMLRMLEETATSFKSVVELQTMGENIPSEAPFIITDRKQPDDSWPSRGEIVFRDIVLRYTEYGVAVLKKVNFVVQPREKVGIVGRTGSGKSTLLIALLRITEPCGGQIAVDGIDVQTIGLKMLRKRIAIIPQEPVLFVGTVRSNLDPYGESDDPDIWRSLAAVHLDTIIKTMPGGLNAEVVENGRNFSLGQRQLFCIARAILSKSCIIVLDEATAAIDADTDALVQTAIAENFADCTVLTIAHRLNTIIDSDKILCMDAGRVTEFDKPLALLDNPNGMFTSLVNQTGEQSARKLRQIAEEKQARDVAADKK